MGTLPTVCRQKRGEEEEKEASIPVPWTDADEAELLALKNVPIKMANTSSGRFLAMQKRDAAQTFQHMYAAKREAFLWRLTEINAADVRMGDSHPLTPPPLR